MSLNVFDLAQDDTRLSRVSNKEYAGPCPKCLSTDSFHVQPYSREGGAWMCRKCWDPSEIITVKGEQRKRGWGDNIEYLQQFRGMSFTAAQAFLSGQVDTAIERVEQAHNKKLEQYGRAPNQTWQARAIPYAEQAQARLWTPEGRAGIDYLLSRELSENTIDQARLGYALYRIRLESGERRVIPCIVIPWFTDGVYWRINLLNMSRKPDEAKYYNVPGSSNAGLYGGDLLKYSRPVFLVEGELDALSIAQVAGDLVSVVATGTTTGSRTDKWVARLAMSPTVLVAYDNDPDGEKAAKYWLHVLEHNAIRYRPIFHKDVNAMLVADRELVRTWVTAALDYLNGEPGQELAFCCSVCGLDLTDVERACYSLEGVAFCDYREDTKEAYCSRGSVRTQPGTYEQFLEYARRLAAVLGPDCKIMPIEPGYTLKQHVKKLEQREREKERQTWQSRGGIKAG